MIRNRSTTRALAILGMESCWLSAAVALFWGLFGHHYNPPLFMGVLALFILGYGATWLLQHLEYPERVLRALTVILALAAVALVATVELEGWRLLLNPFLPGKTVLRGLGWFGGLGRETFVLGAGLLIWWRGSRWTQRSEAGLFDFVFSSFRWGTVIVALSALIEGLLQWPVRVAAVAIPFFGFGLWALVLSHLSRVYPRSAADRRWQTASIGSVGVLLLLGLLLGRPGFFGVWALRGLGRALGVVAERLLLVIAYPLGWLIEIMVKLFRSLFPQARFPEVRPSTLLEDTTREVQQVTDFGIWGILLGVAKALLIVAIVVLLIWWLAWSFGWRRRLREEEEEMREAIPRERSLLWELAALLGRWVGRAQRAPRALFAVLPEVLSGMGGVMLLYRNLCTLASTRGRPRHLWETPAEYQRRLEQLLPEGAIEEITAAFTAARYGERLPSNDRWQYLRRLWEELRRPSRPAAAEPAATSSSGEP